MGRLFNSIIALVAPTILLVSLIIYLKKEDKQESNISPHTCISYKEYSLRQAKYEMYLDSLVHAKKSNRARLQDSVTKHLKQLNF